MFLYEYCRSGSIEMCVNNTADLSSINPTSALTNVHISSATSYSHCKGFYFGLGIEGTVFHTRNDINLDFYGRHVTASEILSRNSQITPPIAAYPLYEALYKISQEYVSNNSKNNNSNSNGNSLGNKKILINNNIPVPLNTKPKAKKRNTINRKRASILI